MSDKKLNFLSDYSVLSRWGGAGVPFVALVDFSGQLLAAPVTQQAWSAGQVLLSGARLHFRFSGLTRQRATLAQLTAGPAISVVTLPDRAHVLGALRGIQAEMREGYSYLVNYCSQTLVDSPYTAQQLYSASGAPFTFWLEGHFLSFSPEPFVTVSGLRIGTTPMKGTGTDRAQLLADSKEQAEHATVVDLLRNDLGKVAGDVRVEDYRYVTAIRRGDGSELYQTSSRICGQMPSDWREHIGDWLPRLLPAGSISGAPKKETLELIRRFEAEPRGFFTGVAVLFDGRNLFSAVLIRFLDLTSAQLRFRSGAGITIYSEPEKEYEEIIGKVYFPL